MTEKEQAEQIVVKYMNGGTTDDLISDILALVRDQRHACADAVAAIDRNAWSKDAAMRAVMNASL